MRVEGKIVEKLENIDGHLSEIKESIVGKTPTLISIEEHLTRQDKKIENIGIEMVKMQKVGRWSVRIGFFTIFAAITLAALFPTFLLQVPPNEVSRGILNFFVALGVVGMVMSWFSFKITTPNRNRR